MEERRIRFTFDNAIQMKSSNGEIVLLAKEFFNFGETGKKGCIQLLIPQRFVNTKNFTLNITDIKWDEYRRRLF